MPLAGIYALTDETLLPEKDMCTAVELALQGGIRVLQYRNKRGDERLRQRQASALLELCQAYSVPLLINDDPRLCLKTGAQGVHLGQTDCRLSEARQLLGDEAVIGITCHQSLDLALEAERNGASYVAFGRFYPSSTKPGAPAADPAILGAAKQALAIPVVAIGGINAENGASLITAGADMLAVAGGLFGNTDIAANSRNLVSLFNQQQDFR
jgi:thiamine-phosphate pyrophosphorylase